MKRTLWIGLLLIVSQWALAERTEIPLIELPENSELKFNGPYLVNSTISLSGTGQQSVIVTADIDLKGASEEAFRSRVRAGAVIEKLKELKNFDKLERVFCFIDFNGALERDIMIRKRASFKFKTPDQYGSPTKFTQLGKRITLDTEHDSTLSASFESPNVSEGSSYEPLVRRLYCSFTAVPEAGWGTDFVSDMKVSHLEILLAPYFDLTY